MGRRRTGNLLTAGDHFVARVLLDGKTVRIHLPPGMSEARARETAQFYTDNPDKARERLEQQARGRSNAAPIPKGETFAEYLERWLKDREERGYSNVGSDRSAFKLHVLPDIGTKPIATLTREDLEKLVQVLDGKITRKEYSWQSVSKLWLAVGKLFKDASASKNLALRVRADNPALGITPPDRGTEKSKAYLYPDEFLKLASCEEVDLELRRLYALTIYLYCRVSEALQLRWTDIDLEHGVAHIRRSYDRQRKQEKGTKGKRPRGFRIEPNLLPLLRVLYAERDDSGFVIRVRNWAMARRFRKALTKAGITRPDLFIADELHKRITFHDLRATGCTWMALRGDTPHVIMQRAGHRNFETTMLYIREAESVTGNVGEPFPPLPASLLGSTKGHSTASGNLSGNLSMVPRSVRETAGIIGQAKRSPYPLPGCGALATARHSPP